MQLIRRLEGRTQAFTERHLIHLHRPVEEGLGLPWAPGRIDHRLHVPVGEEVEPSPVRTPSRTHAVDAVAGERCCLPGLDVANQNLREAVSGRLRPGDPSAVRRPGKVGASFAIGRDLDLFLGGEVEEPDAVVVVGVTDPLAVGRRLAVEAQDLAVGGECLLLADAVAGQGREFEFAGGIGESEKALPIRHEPHVAVADARFARGGDQAARARGCDEHASARCEHRRVALGMQMHGGEELHRFLRPLLSQLVEVRGQCDGDQAFGSGGEIEEPQVRAHLIDEPTGIEGGPFHIPPRVPRVRSQIAAFLVHGPDVHGAVPIAHEIHPAVPPLGGMTFSRVAFGQDLSLGRAFGVLPDLAGLASLVSLGHIVVKSRPDKIQGAPRGIVSTLGSRAQRNAAALAGLEIDLDQLWIGQSGEVLCGVNEIARRGPGRGRRGFGPIRSSRGDAAFERHGVHLNRSLIPRGESQSLSVRRDHGV